MNTKMILASVTITVWAILSSASDVSGGDTIMSASNIKTQLKSLSGDMREQYLSDLMRERLSVQEELMRLLDQGQSDDIRFCAAYLLGMYRMDGAVTSLAQHIRMEQTREIPRDREALWGRYPVVEALVRIGIPSIPVMIETIETASDEGVRNLSAQVIRNVYGLDIAKQVIEKRAQIQTDQQKREHLREVILLPFFAQ